MSSKIAKPRVSVRRMTVKWADRSADEVHVPSHTNGGGGPSISATLLLRRLLEEADDFDELDFFLRPDPVGSTDSCSTGFGTHSTVFAPSHVQNATIGSSAGSPTAVLFDAVDDLRPLVIDSDCAGVGTGAERSEICKTRPYSVEATTPVGLHAHK